MEIDSLTVEGVEVDVSRFRIEHNFTCVHYSVSYLTFCCIRVFLFTDYDSNRR